MHCSCDRLNAVQTIVDINPKEAIEIEARGGFETHRLPEMEEKPPEQKRHEGTAHILSPCPSQVRLRHSQQPKRPGGVTTKKDTLLPP